MENNLRPARVTSPGQIIRRELDARGWTQRDLAAIMDRPYQAVNEIIKGSKMITPETARELALAFGTSVDFWMNLEANYRLFLAEQKDKENQIERRSRLYSITPVTELINRGWIKPQKDILALEQEICGFLKITSPDQKPALAMKLRQSQTRTPEMASEVAWLKRVEQLAEQQRVSKFSKTGMDAGISELLNLARRIEDVALVPQTLKALGIHFLIVPHLPRTYIDGAALHFNGEPIVALTLRYDRIDAFWFTLLHELAHIYLAHPAHLDENFGEEADSDAGGQNDENQANALAQRWLLEPSALASFIQRTTPFFSKVKIEQFALQQRRHPGIVLGQLQRQGLVDYKNLRTLLVKVRPYLADWLDRPA